MPRSGGTYNLPAPPNPFVPGTLALAEDVNTTFTDIANALTTSVATDGSSAATGPITLPADPTQPLQAATKQYVDAQRNFVTANYVAKAGDTMTGPLTVGGNGIHYSGFDGGGNFISYSWDGTYISGIVNGSNIGQMATTGWTNGAFLPLAGGTITGNLAVGGIFTASSGASINYLTTNLNANGQQITNASYLQSNGNVQANGNLGVNGTGNVSGNFTCFQLYTSAPGAAHGFSFSWDGASIYAHIDNSGIVLIGGPSSRAAKTNIAPAALDCLALVNAAPVVQFDMLGNGAHKPLGFIAEDVPDIAWQNDKGAGIDPTAALAAAYGAIQQLTARIIELERKHA